MRVIGPREVIQNNLRDIKAVAVILETATDVEAVKRYVADLRQDVENIHNAVKQWEENRNAATSKVAK